MKKDRSVPSPPVSLRLKDGMTGKLAGPDGLMKTDMIPYIVGRDGNRLTLTPEGARALATLLLGIRSKDANERMYAARTLSQLIYREDNLRTYLRESVEHPARQFGIELNKAFSIGDKELNVVLKQIRRRAYSVPKPRHCMIIPVEALEAHMKNREKKEGSDKLSPNETFYAYCRKMISLHLGPGFKQAPTIDGSVDPEVSESEVLEAIENLDMDDPELEYGLGKMAEISIHESVREAARAKLESK